MAVIVAATPGTVASATAVAAPAAPAGQLLPLVLPLKADDVGLAGFAHSVSTPSSPAYGHYASFAMLARRYGASLWTRDQVVGYLSSHGASKVSVDPTHMFVFATMSVADAQRAFGVHLGSFSARGARFVAPTSHVYLPGPLRGLIDGVVGLSTRPVASAPAPAQRRHAGNAPAHAQPPTGYFPATGTPGGCPAGVASGGFTPNQYRAAYDYQSLRTARLGGQGERVALIEINGFRYSDIKTFAHCFGLDVPAITTYSAGTGRRLPPGGEATLDLEVLDAVAPDLGELEVFETPPDTASVLRAYLAPLLYPLFELNHRIAARRGAEGMRAYFRREPPRAASGA